MGPEEEEGNPKGEEVAQDGRKHIDPAEAKLGCVESVKSCINFKSVVGLVIFLAMFIGFYFIIIFGYLEEFRVMVTSLGVGAYFIFIGIFLIAAQPFGEFEEPRKVKFVFYL